MHILSSRSEVGRRQFISLAALSALTPGVFASELAGDRLAISETLGPIRKDEGQAPIEGATWYVAGDINAGFVHRFEPGWLAKGTSLAADMLLDGNTLATFLVELHEGEAGRVFQYAFGAMNQCSFRVHVELDLVNQNRFFLRREGGLLKPMCLGDRVDIDKVDRMVFLIRRKSTEPARWCMTPFHLVSGEVERITDPILPKGPLLDEFGQSAIRDWPGKTRSVEELKVRIQGQYERAGKQEGPADFSRWGGWKGKKLGEGTGFFRTHNDGRRWWLADPEGYAFWSAGLDDVRVDCDASFDGLRAALKWLPDPNGEFAAAFRGGRGGGGRSAATAGAGGRAGAGFGGGSSVNYLVVNLIRALGQDGWREKWGQIALSEMKRLRFNTVGNWSDIEIARAARFPYVRPLGFRGAAIGTVYRDFPDVFRPEFQQAAADFGAQLQDTRDDPALIGYFLMNEPQWGSSSEVPAAGMLFNTESCASRAELARFLKTRYTGDAALAAAWKRPVTFDQVAKGKWTGVLAPQAQADLTEFSVRMVEHYFRGLSEACRKVDPHHLNLGMRWAGPPPEWAVQGMKFFDVFSLNRYADKLPREQSEKIHSLLQKPVMVGEFHFGALDAGLPASGIGQTKNQEDRAKAYRIYVEDAAANPHCVGAHWFTMYDESALGRSDGENYNIGFFDICNRAYDAMGRAAIATHERLYQVADGKTPPFNEKIEYLPRLYL